MEKVTYISDNGLFLVFDEIGPYLLSSIDTMGVGSIEDSDMSIGGIYNTYMSGYDQRSVPMEIAILGGERKGWFDLGGLQQMKIKLANTIDLNYQGTLVYENDTGAYALRGRFTEIPAGFDRIGSNEKFSLTFQSTEQPKWKERNERVVRMGAVIGGLSFPLVIDPVFEFGTYTTTFVVINDTYDNLPVRIVVIGTAESVTITNESSGEYMQFNRSIDADQQLEVDTEKGTAVIKSAATGQVIENASHYLTLDSDYWYLQRGRNVINLDGGGQTNHPLGYMFWQKQYGGV